MTMKTAGIVVISDAILENTHLFNPDVILNGLINELGYKVGKVCVLPGNVNIISNELELMVQYFDIIITIGGVESGIVYKSIGKSVGDDLIYRKELADRLNVGFKNDEVAIPRKAKILNNDSVDDTYPVIHLQRIFVLNMECLRVFPRCLEEHLRTYREERIYQKTIKVQRNGNNKSMSFKLNPNSIEVEFMKDGEFLIYKLTSQQLSRLNEFENQIRTNYEYHRITTEENFKYWDLIYNSNEAHIKFAIENIQRCLEQHGPSNVFISFNGGKDCTVLLHLILVVIRKCYSHYNGAIFCLYVQSQSPFPEQDRFIEECRQYYNLEIMTIQSGIKAALEQTLSKWPHYTACFMGTRRTDPYCSHSTVFQMTDGDWPQIMRVSPLLDWHYSDIWDYLLFYKVPYCQLYDMGYTSLGNTNNTTKNPSLLYYDIIDECEKFLPAYKLLKETKERNGRNAS